MTADRFQAPGITVDRFGRRDVVLSQAQSALALDRITGLRCNHVLGLLELVPCAKLPEWSPRFVVPSRTQDAEGHRHIQADIPNLHYCDDHMGELKIDDVLRLPRFKREIEAHAKRTRPLDFKPDFEFAAHIDYVNVFTPDYKLFGAMQQAGLTKQRIYALWGTPIVSL